MAECTGFINEAGKSSPSRSVGGLPGGGGGGGWEAHTGIVQQDESGLLMSSGWKCAICFEYASVFMINVTLCEEHAKRHNFGYGDTLQDLRKEYDRRSEEADDEG